MEKYSVLMSLYIKEKPEYLNLSIKSMLEQTYKPDEIIIVKDGKITKELQDVLNRYKKNYPTLLHIIGYEENRGLGYALNYGLKFCRNELVARMDTDDISRPDRCEKQVRAFEKNESLEMIGGDIAEFIEYPNNIVAYRKVPTTNEKIREYMKTRCPFNHMTVMFKKSSVIRAGNYQDWFWNEDYYLWIRMMQNKCVFQNTGNVLVDVRTGVDMYSRRGGKKYFDSEIALQKYMVKNHIISFKIYILNIAKRIIIQRILSKRIRGWVYRKFARE